MEDLQQLIFQLELQCSIWGHNMLGLGNSISAVKKVVLPGGKLSDGDWIKMTDVNWTDQDGTNWDSWVSASDGS